MKRKTTFYLVLAAFAAAIVALDQWTKWLVRRDLPLYASKDSILGIFHITHVENTGGAWSMFSGQLWLFIGVMALFVALIVVRIWKQWLKKPFEWWCLAAILGGGIGNLIDRVATGVVVDYINVLFMNFAIFNFADICVCVGVGLLMVWVLFDSYIKEKAEKNAAPDAADDAHGNA